MNRSVQLLIVRDCQVLRLLSAVSLDLPHLEVTVHHYLCVVLAWCTFCACDQHTLVVQTQSKS